MHTELDPERVGAPARILKAALALFTERGYHGTSVRTIASVVGLEAASLYHHFPSKQRILFEIFERTMNELLAGMENALAGDETIEGKLRALLRFHVFFHVERQQGAFLSHSELRSLTASNRQRILAKRDRYERRLRDLLASGVEAGLFEVRDVQLATIAILMMWSGVSDWFVAGKRLTPDAVADIYCDMTLALLRRKGDRGPALGDSGPELPGIRAVA
jgi:AcrR family transcriptional regulator